MADFELKTSHTITFSIFIYFVKIICLQVNPNTNDQILK